MKAFIAVDSFKGSLTSMEAGAAAAEDSAGRTVMQKYM